MNLIRFYLFNKPLLKVTLLAVLTISCLWLVCYKFVLAFPFQFAFLFFANVIYAGLNGFRANLKLWKTWIKRLLILLIVNLVFAYVDIRFDVYNKFFHAFGYTGDLYGSVSKIDFYRINITKTFLTLMNTVVLLDTVLNLITFSDLLFLPVSIHMTKKMLFFKSILNFLTDKVKLNDIAADMIPEFQHYQSQNRFVDFRFLFKKNLISILTMLKLVNEQSLIIGELIDNKINHTIKNGILRK